MKVFVTIDIISDVGEPKRVLRFERVDTNLTITELYSDHGRSLNIDIHETIT